VYTNVEYFLSNRLTDHVVCVSHDLEQKYKPHCPRAGISTIHNGIDTRKFYVEKMARPVNGDRIRFGFVSRMSQQKGLPYLVEAWRRIHENYADSGRMPELWMVGTGEEEARIRAMVRDYGLEDSVTFLGFRKDIPDILAQIDVLVLPSLFEGLPMIVLESLCSGTPVIASKVNGVPEVVRPGENGRLVAPGNVGDLVQSMAGYIEQPGLIREHGRSGQLLVTGSFTKEAMLQKHADLYDSLLGGQQNGAGLRLIRTDAPEKRESGAAI
jgi:glycosyltransferase involved in cell wall biosynthesis